MAKPWKNLEEKMSPESLKRSQEQADLMLKEIRNRKKKREEKRAK